MTHSSSKFENMAMNSGQFYTLSSLAWFACQTLIQSFRICCILQLFFHVLQTSGINVGVRLLILGLFSNGYVLIKGGTIITFFISLFFRYFFACFTLAMYKKINLSVILRGGYAYSMGYVYCFCKKFQGLRLFKGVRLLSFLFFIF